MMQHTKISHSTAWAMKITPWAMERQSMERQSMERQRKQPQPQQRIRILWRVLGAVFALSFILSFMTSSQAQDTTAVTEVVQINTQTPDERLDNYNKALQLLRSGMEIFPNDNAEAQRNIESAAIFFSELQAGGIGENSLVDGVGITFERAQMAIQQRLSDDLAIQITVIEGGLQRLLYEAASGNFNTGEFTIGKNRIIQIAQDMGANEEQIATLEATTDSTSLLNNFELFIANNIQNFTTEAQHIEAGIAMGESSLSEAYHALAKAYSNYIVIQDSSHIPSETKGAFSQAIHSLLDTNQGTDLDFAQEIQGLNTYIEQFRGQANQALGIIDETITTPVQVEPVSIDTGSTEPSNALNVNTAATEPINIVPVAPVSVPDTSLNTSANVTIPNPNIAAPNLAQTAQDSTDNATPTLINIVADTADNSLDTTTNTFGNVTDNGAGTNNALANTNFNSNAPDPTLATEAQDDVRTPLINLTTETDSDVNTATTATSLTPPIGSQISTSEDINMQLTAAQSQKVLNAQLRDSARRNLNDFRLNAGTVDSLVNNFADNQIATLEDVFQRLYSSAARSTTQVEVGNYVEAREEINKAESDYRRYLQPIIAELDPKQDVATQGLFKTFSKAPSLRLQDIAILAGQIRHLETTVESVRRTGQIAPANGLHNLIAQISHFWVGPLRIITMFIIALLAIIPLVLLNRAFGVNNANWRWVGLAFFLLLLPAIYEGIAFALGWVAQLLGQPSLDSLSRFSIFQNELTQIIWALLTLLAIIFASIGFYGICVQFGVLGGGRRKATVITQSDARLSSTTGDMGADTVVDWDEDF